jgi:hypothetical protein
MQPSEQSPIVEAFLLIEQPRQRLGHWTQALAALDGPNAPPVSSIVAYYDPTSDQALLDLQYDAETANMKFVVEVALLAEVGMVQPSELSEGERVRFLADRLTRCTIRVISQRTATGALGELVRKIRDQRANKVVTQPPPIPQAALARSVQPRGDTHDPVMLVQAKGTRDNLERLPDELGDGPEPPPPPRVEMPLAPPGPPPRRDATVKEERMKERPSASSILARPDRHRTVPMPVELAEKLIGESSQMLDLRTLPPPPARSEQPQLPLPAPPKTPTPTLISNGGATPSISDAKTNVREKTPAPARKDKTPPPSSRNEKPTVRQKTAPPHQQRVINPETSRLLTDVDVQPPLRHKTPAPVAARGSASAIPAGGQRRVEASTEPYLPTPGQRHLPNVIYARYLRSGRWVPVRVGALSLKGAALLAGALPRLDDRVDVAFTFGSQRAIVRGVVGKVSSMREATQTGASTFTVSFELDNSSRRQLTALLTAARDARITIKPPPPRATRRFPVEWQVALGTVRGAVKATALDVSMQGMFVQPSAQLEPGSTLTFSIMLDDGTSPIAGRARVVREIKAPEAKECGLLPGFGLLIVSMSEADRMRWLGFLARIERRADKRVLIGADPARLAELQAGLASLGYAVTGGTDPGALVQLASTDGRPADAVLIDAGWLQNEASASLMENLFTARNVPCVTMQGEVRRARQAIDKLLEVVV